MKKPCGDLAPKADRRHAQFTRAAYRTYFNGEQQAGWGLPLGPQSSWAQFDVAARLVLVSFVGFVLTAIFLWSVR
jgi:hypothetical protein